MRERIIERLEEVDANGCYGDDDALAEFGRVWTEEELVEMGVRHGVVLKTGMGWCCLPEGDCLPVKDHDEEVYAYACDSCGKLSKGLKPFVICQFGSMEQAICPSCVAENGEAWGLR